MKFKQFSNKKSLNPTQNSYLAFILIEREIESDHRRWRWRDLLIIHQTNRFDKRKNWFFILFYFSFFYPFCVSFENLSSFFRDDKDDVWYVCDSVRSIEWFFFPSIFQFFLVDFWRNKEGINFHKNNRRKT